ncbi:MAG: tyrosine-type recombinase/integrase [Deltaproteobacteria bacterium]|nr:tyrosine-type recombinase/integrase [Deltaproteobacteria bacterium]
MRRLKGLWQGRRDYWYFQITFPDGRRVQRSSGAKIYAEARTIFLEAREAALRGDVLEKAKMPTVKEYRSLYLDALKSNGRKLSTQRSAAYSLGNVIRRFGNTPLNALIRDDLNTYKQERLDAGMSPYSINRELRALKGLLNHARKGKLIGELPAGLELLRTDALPEPEPYTFEEQAALISKPLDPRARAYYLLAFAAGLRYQEIAWLRWDDLEAAKDDPDGTILVHVRPKQDGAETWSPKNRQRRVALLDRETWAILEEYQIGLDVKSPWVIPGRHGERFRNPTKFLRQAAQEAGVYRKGKLVHAARHSFGTTMAQIAPLRDVQAMMGHSSPLVTERYLHADVRAQREALRKAGFGKAAQDALRGRDGAQIISLQRR